MGRNCTCFTWIYVWFSYFSVDDSIYIHKTVESRELVRYSRSSNIYTTLTQLSRSHQTSVEQIANCKRSTSTLRLLLPTRNIKEKPFNTIMYRFTDEHCYTWTYILLNGFQFKHRVVDTIINICSMQLLEFRGIGCKNFLNAWKNTIINNIVKCKFQFVKQW